VLFRLWYGAGRPKPHLSVLVLIVMSWVTLGLVIVWVFEYTVQWGMEKFAGCSLGAHEDLSPKLWINGVFIALSTVACAVAALFRRKRRWAPPQDPQTVEDADVIADECGNARDTSDSGDAPPTRSPRKKQQIANNVCESVYATTGRIRDAANYVDRMYHGPSYNPVELDRRRCCWVHLGVFVLFSAFSFFWLGRQASSIATPSYTDDLYHKSFGFLLEEGKSYTSPVFIGEFGDSEHSAFLQKTLNYISDHDLDWAIWPLNPVRPVGGSLGLNGGLKESADPHAWQKDTWSVLDKDWERVRHPWLLQGLKPVMMDPVVKTGAYVPCDRSSATECGN